MDRPDTLIELHRQHVEALAADVYQGQTYQQPYDGSYGEKGQATLTLELGRVWFLYDMHDRLWQEEGPSGTHDPIRHFAIDLEITDGRVLITSIAGIPLIPLPAATITIPDGPRQGEQRQVAYNELPLMGRLTIHEQLEARPTAPGKQTVSLNFNPELAPILVAMPPSDPLLTQLHGPNIERRNDGSTAFAGQDPRVVWDLDYAEAYWILQSNLGKLLLAKESVLHPLASSEEHRQAVLDGIASEISAAVQGMSGTLGDDGFVDLLPNPMDVDPTSVDGTRALDAIVQQFDAGGSPQESLVIQLQTMDRLPDGEELPASVLIDQPQELIAVATAGFGILRGVRNTIKRTFCLDDSDFVPELGCQLAGSREVNIGGEMRTLRRIKATIEEGTDTSRGRLIVDGKVSDDTTLYEFDATFTVTYELDLDDIPREAGPGEVGTSTGETKAQLDAGLREASEQRCSGQLDPTDYEAEAKRVSDLYKELPRTVGVRPTANPPDPEIDSDFSLTWEGYALAALGVAALIAMLAAPAVGFAGLGASAAALGAEGAVLALIASIAFYIALVIDIDWYGTGMVRGKLEDALGDRPGGSLLPTLGVPVDVQLRRHLGVYFRPLPHELLISCVKHDTKEDIDDVIQLVGGTWPTDGKPWRISDADGAAQINEGRLTLFVDLGNGARQDVHTSVSSAGRPYLRTDPNSAGVDNLSELPECGRVP